MPSYTSLRNEGNGRNYQSNFHGTLEQVISDWKDDCARQDVIWSILIEEPTGKVVERLNPTNIITEEKPMQVFLNPSLKPYNDLTREEKHILLDAMIDGNCEECEIFWDKVSGDLFYTHGIYRTKPKEYKKLDIPWQFVDEMWKYAVIDGDGDSWFFEHEPVWDTRNEMWTNVVGIGGDFTTLVAFKLDTTGIVAEHSLTQRPEGV